MGVHAYLRGGACLPGVTWGGACLPGVTSNCGTRAAMRGGNTREPKGQKVRTDGVGGSGGCVGRVDVAGEWDE